MERKLLIIVFGCAILAMGVVITYFSLNSTQAPTPEDITSRIEQGSVPVDAGTQSITVTQENPLDAIKTNPF